MCDWVHIILFSIDDELCMLMLTFVLSMVGWLADGEILLLHCLFKVQFRNAKFGVKTNWGGGGGGGWVYMYDVKK